MKKQPKKISEEERLKRSLQDANARLLIQKSYTRSLHKLLCEAVTFAQAMAICELINDGHPNTAYETAMMRLSNFLDKADRLVDQRDL